VSKCRSTNPKACRRNTVESIPVCGCGKWAIITTPRGPLCAACFRALMVRMRAEARVQAERDILAHGVAWAEELVARMRATP